MAHNTTASEISATSALSGMSVMSDEKEFYQPDASKELKPPNRYTAYSPGRSTNAQMSDLPEVGPDPDVFSQKITTSPQQYTFVSADKYSAEPVAAEKPDGNDASAEPTTKRSLPWYRQRLNVCIIITLIAVIIVAVVVGAVAGTVLPKHDKK